MSLFIRKMAIRGSWLLVGCWGLTGCVTSVQQQGQSLQAVDVSEIKPGVDTKASVVARYGRPSTISLFPGSAHTERWYYTHRILTESPVKGRKAIVHRSLVIVFDASGKVVRCDAIVGERSVPVKSKTTKEQGYETNFLKETFRNIGKFGQSSSSNRE